MKPVDIKKAFIFNFALMAHGCPLLKITSQNDSLLEVLRGAPRVITK